MGVDSLAKAIKSISEYILCERLLQNPLQHRWFVKQLFQGIDRQKQRQRHIAV